MDKADIERRALKLLLQKTEEDKGNVLVERLKNSRYQKELKAHLDDYHQKLKLLLDRDYDCSTKLIIYEQEIEYIKEAIGALGPE